MLVVVPALALLWLFRAETAGALGSPILNASVAATVLIVAAMLWAYGKRRCQAYHVKQRRAAVTTRR
jgi:hypothetical protein